MKTSKTNMLVIVLILFIPQAGLALITPSLVSMSETVHLSMSVIMASYAIGMGFGQIIWGTYSDFLGRKQLMVLGISLFAISSLLITMLTNAYFVACLRFLQGFATGSMFSITTAIMCDQYKEGALLVGSLAISEFGFGAAWIILPFCGGIIEHLGSWKINFYIMVLYVIMVTILSWKYLKETKAKNQIKTIEVTKKFFLMFLNPLYLSLALLLLLPNAFFLVFNSIAPKLAIAFLHKSIIFTGFAVSSLGIGYTIAILLNLFFLRKFNSWKIIKIFILLFAISAGIQFLFAYYNFFNIYTLFAPMIIIIMCWCFMFPHITAKAMEEYSNNYGTCASHFGFIFYTGAGLGTYLFSIYFSCSFLGITSFILVTAFIALGLLLFITRKLRINRNEKAI